MNVFFFFRITKDTTVNLLMLIYFQSKTMHMVIDHSREQTQEMCSILMHNPFHINDFYN
jgi:hypothetical protein